MLCRMALMPNSVQSNLHMPKIRVVKVVFNTKIKAYEVPAFRGAVIDMIGRVREYSPEEQGLIYFLQE